MKKALSIFSKRYSRNNVLLIYSGLTGKYAPLPFPWGWKGGGNINRCDFRERYEKGEQEKRKVKKS
jgi:hypothetical protein